MAFQIYANEFKESFPWPQCWYHYLGDRLGNPGDFAPTTGLPRRGVLRCPAEARSRIEGYDPSNVPAHTNFENDHVRSSYAMHWNIGRWNSTPANGPTRKGFYGPTINPGGITEASYIIDAQFWGWPASAPVYTWEVDDLAQLATGWNVYYGDMFPSSEIHGKYAVPRRPRRAGPPKRPPWRDTPFCADFLQ